MGLENTCFSIINPNIIKMTETLSDKKVVGHKLVNGKSVEFGWVYPTKDVKEFIKKLKEWILKRSKSEIPYDKTRPTWAWEIIEKIDKRAGKELIDNPQTKPTEEVAPGVHTLDLEKKDKTEDKEPFSLDEGGSDNTQRGTSNHSPTSPEGAAPLKDHEHMGLKSGGNHEEKEPEESFLCSKINSESGSDDDCDDCGFPKDYHDYRADAEGNFICKKFKQK